MPEDPSLQPPAIPLPSGGSARRRRGHSPWKWRLLGILAVLMVLGVLSLFSLRLWIDRYLKSEGLAARLNVAAGQALGAECRMEGLNWQDPAAYASTFSATGREAAAFRTLTISDLRAEIDTGAIWDRVWRVNHVKIARMTADFSKSPRLPGLAALADEPLVDPVPAGWGQRWLPNRTEIGPVQVDRFDFVSGPDGEPGGIVGGGFSLELKPDLKRGNLEVEARSGEIRLAGYQQPLLLDRMRATLQPEAAAVDQFEGRVGDATVSAEGTLQFQDPGDLRLKVRLSGARLESWLPEDWLRRCTGVASAHAILRGDWRKPEAVRAEGGFQLKEAVLQALPLLDIIAKKTQNASFLRMQIKEATGTFERRGAEDWQVRQLRADAPGLLRMKGTVDVGPGGTLRGGLLLGIVPGTLRYLAGAEQTVFLSAERFKAQAGEAGSLSADDTGLLWTRFALSGTLDEPVEDLSDRLAKAWFNATVEEVGALSMEAASTAARTAAGAANTLLETAPPVLEKAPELLQQGVEGGLKVLDGLLPR